MPLIRLRRGWELAERLATPESVFLSRRRFLQTAALGTIAWATGCRDRAEPGASRAARADAEATALSAPAFTGAYPAKRNAAFRLDRPLTEEAVANRYNNFYEFTSNKDVWRYVGRFRPWPWTIVTDGLVTKPQKWDVEQLVRTMPLEERLYRHRCVEAWAMAVPWTGFPLKALIERAKPLSSAKFARFVSFLRPAQAPGQRNIRFPWPYFEALTMAEATNELAFVVTGIYGHPLPVQHGAPLRLAIPWKYGYKSPKSIVKIEFVESQPATFWNQLAPQEYGFESNVNPRVPHPRWSQATERILGTNERRPTQLYNGYGEYVAALYNR
ncbi:MAG: protein-methionine-sulfoxide reductase catalytic subunit MsrP [Candidatus Binatia bacterium]